MTWYYCLAFAAPWAVTWVSLHSLHRKVDNLMSDVQTLSDTLDAIAEDVTSVTSEISNLEAEIADLQGQVAAGQPVDLSGVLAKATAIRESLEAINTKPAPAPTPEPAPAPVEDMPPADTPTEPVETAPTSSNEFDDNGNPTTTGAPRADTSGQLGDGSGTLG